MGLLREHLRVFRMSAALGPRTPPVPPTRLIGMNETEAWVLHAGEGSTPTPGELRRETLELGALGVDEVLVEPIYGSWDANMMHAISRSPIDVCKQRNESRVVLGNCGVGRVVAAGPAAGVEIGKTYLCFGTGRYDRYGYMELAHGYDAAGTVGLMARRTKLRARNLIELPPDSRFSLAQWAAFSLKYLTAWSNWRVAYGALRLQLSEDDLPRPFVWGWGGGTTLSELDLARHFGCDTVMISGSDKHLEEIAAYGVGTLDRRAFPYLVFDEERYGNDRDYAKMYRGSEKAFLREVHARTEGLGASIFVDFIGTPVLRATLRALGRQGVLATAGWKCGMKSPLVRAVECLARHTHVHTHYARWSEAAAAVAFAEANAWMPDVRSVYAWDDVPMLVSDYAEGRVPSYFAVYAVNLE